MNCQYGNTGEYSQENNLKTAGNGEGAPNTESEILARDQNKLIHLDPIPNFKDKSEIKPWLQKIFYPQGIEIVIERSDNIKVVFKCKAARRGKNTRDRNKTSGNATSTATTDKNETPSPGVTQKKKRSVSRFNTCPFRIRATFSLKRKKWNIVVLNNSHSHPLKFNPDSDEYKKFKAKLKEDNDWEAIKQFDELEYRTLSNLPIRTSAIPCDCGLTNEIRSFNIVLPSTKPFSSTNLQTITNTPFSEQSISTATSASTNTPCTTNSTLQQVKKPKSKKARQMQHKENLLKSTTTQNFLASGKTPIIKHSSISGFLDNSTNFDTAPNHFFDATPAQNTVTDLNEIDFTNMFNKPFYHKQNHHHYRQQQPPPPPSSMDNYDSNNDAHSNSYDDESITFRQQSQLPMNNELLVDNPVTQYGSVLFSPLPGSSHLYLSPSEDVLDSPSYHQRPSITFQGGDTFFDFASRSDLNIQDRNDRSSSKDTKSFTDLAMGPDKMSSSHYDGLSTSNNDRNLHNVLTRGMNEIKMLDTNFKFSNGSHQQSKTVPTQQLQPLQPEPEPEPQSQPKPEPHSLLQSTEQQPQQILENVTTTHSNPTGFQQPQFKQNPSQNDLHEQEHDLYLKDFDINWNVTNQTIDSMSISIDKTIPKKEDDNINYNDQTFWDMNFQNS